MTITAVDLYMGKDENAVLKIEASEDGFSEAWKFTVYLDRSRIDWKDGHFWVRRFFNRKVTRKILQVVNDYFDSLPF